MISSNWQARHLMDSDTGADLGPATEEQIEASDRASPEGHITIDHDTGDVIPASQASDARWMASHDVTLRVYVAA